MTYTKTVWLENSMSSAQKLTALDNLENMYTEGTTYTAAISHAATYYNKTEADARYFTSSNDGSGSGLICATLDGETAQQIIDAGIPSGCIAIWSGSVAAIPSGWYLCNGLNDTPDLRGKFVVASGSHYTHYDTGGANTITTSASITVASQVLTASQIPKHVHSYADKYNVDQGVYWSSSGGLVYFSYTATTTRSTGSYGSSAGHTHTASFAGTSAQNKMPLYYAACFIQKG